MTEDQLRQYVKAIQGMALFFSEDTGVYDSPMAWFKANVALPGEDTTGIAAYTLPEGENGAQTSETTSKGQTQGQEETGASEAEKVPFQLVGENAQTADLSALERARQMDADKATREAIWQETGWYKGADMYPPKEPSGQYIM